MLPRRTVTMLFLTAPLTALAVDKKVVVMEVTGIT